MYPPLPPRANKSYKNKKNPNGPPYVFGLCDLVPPEKILVTALSIPYFFE
jgi:hypothetical protein